MSQLVSRAGAGLRAPRSAASSITTEGTTVHYWGPSPWGSSVDRGSAGRFRATCDHDRCATIWRAGQAYHMDHNGWTDIAYNSGVCPHGVAFEGRGPGKRSAANGTNEGNRRSAACVYIAGAGDPLTPEAMAAIIEEGARLGRGLRWVHQDWKSTACPGQPVVAWKGAGWPAPGGVAAPPSTPAPPPVSVRPIIRRGSRGAAVREWQQVLNRIAGRGLAVDGIFGPATDKATRDFQAMFSLGVDGIVGPKTWGLGLYFDALKRR